MKKTIRQWLSELPDGFRELALERVQYPDTKVNSMTAAITGGFQWRRNPTYIFWKNVVNHYQKGYTLPPLPATQP